MLLFIWYNFLWLLAGFLAGVTSFGGNLFAVPIIAFTMPPREAILFGCISCSAIFLGILTVYFRHVLWRDVFYVCTGSLAGIPFGLWFLGHAGARALLLAAGASLTLFLCWQAAVSYMRKSEGAIKAPWGLFFGVFSGLMMSSLGMGGPPLALYVYLRKLGKEATLATVNAASLTMMLIVLPVQHSWGLFSGEILKYGLWGSIFGFAGIAISIRVVHHMNVALFRRLLLGMLAISAIILLGRGFWGS